MSQTPSRIVLTTARSLIAEQRSWLQYGWFRSGKRIMSRCAYQAVADAAKMHGLEDHGPLALLAAAINSSAADPRQAIPAFNDSHAHAEMLAMFDRAIAMT